MSTDPDIHDLLAFVLERAVEVPAARRARLYTALSTIAPTRASAQQLVQMASTLREVDRASGQLLLELQHPSSSGNGSHP